ncbi:hypothetical protein Y032_0055g2565 [Ancylostoma ceylanicum]|uniref:Uncharacterized protein n=1 Tax=Ancylostoma ceylanicum TaxID=53326 RepID=A0A016U5M8_9BILA|nr:hypothetical protein Y032_0055g2565 [Ancylostoma ceylanicum]
MASALSKQIYCTAKYTAFTLEWKLHRIYARDLIHSNPAKNHSHIAFQLLRHSPNRSLMSLRLGLLKWEG